MFNHQALPDQQNSGISSLKLQVLTAEQYAALIGSPLGVVEEQIDRNELPITLIGNQRFVNVEALQKSVAFEAAHVPARASRLPSSRVESPPEKSLLLSINGTAQCLEIAPKTIRKWLSNGTCPFPTVLIGARRLVRRCDLEKFVSELGTSPAVSNPSINSTTQEVKRGRGRPRHTLENRASAAQGGSK
jgi:hypothetical protein